MPQLALFARMDRARFRPAERVAKAKGQLRAGLRYVWREPDLRLPLLLVTAVGTMAFNFSVILPLFATRDLDGGPATFTTLFSVMSVGSVVGALDHRTAHGRGPPPSSPAARSRWACRWSCWRSPRAPRSRTSRSSRSGSRA